jgi:hypothetical protein
MNEKVNSMDQNHTIGALIWLYKSVSLWNALGDVLIFQLEI